MTIRRGTWQTNSLPTEGIGASFSGEGIQSFPGPRRMFVRIAKSQVAGQHVSLSQHRGEALRRCS